MACGLGAWPGGKLPGPGRGAGSSGRKVTRTRPPSLALATRPSPTTRPAGPVTRPFLPRHQAPVYGTPGPINRAPRPAGPGTRPFLPRHQAPALWTPGHINRAPRPAWAWVLRGNKPGRPGPWVWALGPGPARALLLVIILSRLESRRLQGLGNIHRIELL